MEKGKARKVLNLAQRACGLLVTPWSQGHARQEEIPAAEAGGGEGTLALSFLGPPREPQPLPQKASTKQKQRSCKPPSHSRSPTILGCHLPKVAHGL